MSTLMAAPPATAPKREEGGHWYGHTPEAGWYPLYKEGGTFTLREARKMAAEGHVAVPSVTTIFKMLNKRQLIDWMRTNVAKACLAHPRSAFANDEQYIEHVLAVADNASKGAADLGTSIHKAIEQALSHDSWDASLDAYVSPVLKAMEDAGIKGISESCAGSLKYGYGGRVDISEGATMTVCDFKSRKSRKGKVTSYGTDRQQLAAYGFALWGNAFFTQGRGIIYGISTSEPGVLTPHEWTGRELVPAFEAFLGLCAAWRFEHEFDPRVATKGAA